jgi:hypothetical protein
MRQMNAKMTIIAPTIRTFSADGMIIAKPPYAASASGARVRYIFPVRVLMYRTWNGSRFATMS